MVRMTICIHAIATELPGSAPEWVHLVPSGNFRGRDGRGPYRIEPKRVIEASKDALQSENAVVDYGHELWSGPMNGAAARNAGFIRELDARDNGIWARIDWTSAAKHALAEREYRGISPVFSHDKAGNVLKLLGAGLTNKPNLELVSFNSEQEVAMTIAQRLAAAFGLPDAATDDEIVTHAEAIKAKLADATKRIDETQVALQSQKASATTLEQAVASLQTQLTALHTERVTAQVDDLIKSGRALPFERDVLIAMSSAMPDHFQKLLKDRPVIVQMGASDVCKDKPKDGKKKLTDDQLAFCSRMNIKPEDFASNMEEAA